jgi:hypothetical protein
MEFQNQNYTHDRLSFEIKYNDIKNNIVYCNIRKKTLINILAIDQRIDTAYNNINENLKSFKHDRPDGMIVGIITQKSENYMLSKSFSDQYVGLILPIRSKFRASLNQMIFLFYFKFLRNVIDMNKFHTGSLEILQKLDADNTHNSIYLLTIGTCKERMRFADPHS